MDFYVLNTTGGPVRVMVIRPTREDPDELLLLVAGENDGADDVAGTRLFDRVLRDPREGVAVPCVAPGTTLTYHDRLGVNSRVTLDDDGDKLLIIGSMVN